jgi:hypothetical protein
MLFLLVAYFYKFHLKARMDKMGIIIRWPRFAMMPLPVENVTPPVVQPRKAGKNN